ncbi:oligosaccharide repeat unit polymerase [Actinomyces qiguomingii]|uniref:oligosaccharide repeat unit polymerase n=1 Tax=Actinomyces qiguomingii TaxID=2057800 RepID=UPI000CA081FA|nr:oligosaccharide repeat unit polymerase [Actinomyces qiguomingii]
MFKIKTKFIVVAALSLATVLSALMPQPADAAYGDSIKDYVQFYSYYQALLSRNGGSDASTSDSCISNNMRSVFIGDQNKAPSQGESDGSEWPSRTLFGTQHQHYTWFGTNKYTDTYVWPRNKMTCANIMKNMIDLRSTASNKYADFLRKMNGEYVQCLGAGTWGIFKQDAIKACTGVTADGADRQANFTKAVAALNGGREPALSNEMKYYAYLTALNTSKICITQRIAESDRATYAAHIGTGKPVPTSDYSSFSSKLGVTLSGDSSLYFYDIPFYSSATSPKETALFAVVSTTDTLSSATFSGTTTPIYSSASMAHINSMWSGPGGTVDCADMAKALATDDSLASAWRNWIEKHPNDVLKPGEGTTTDATKNIDLDAANDAEAGEKTCNIDGIGWIVCPVVNFLAGIADDAKGYLNNWLEFPATYLGNGAEGSVESYWRIMRDYANVLLVIAFLVIIYSQLTGFGLSNYGIKSMLPKLVICVLLINVSFYICGALVDVSNLVGSAAFNFISAATSGEGNGGYWSSGADGAGGAFTVLAASILSATAVAWFAVGAISTGLIAIVLIALTTVVLLGARQAIIIMLIVVSPLAFAAMLLPNTEGLFKKWWQIFKTMLFLYPTIGVLYGAARLASNMINSVHTTSEDGMMWTVQIIGAVLSFLPLLLVPTVIKKAMDVGNISNMVGRLQGSANKYLGGKARERAERGNIAQLRKFRAEKAELRRGLIRGGAYTGRGGKWNYRNWLSAGNRRFNASRWSGDFGNRRAMAGSYAEDADFQEQMKMANASVRDMGLSNDDLFELGSTGKIGDKQYSHYQQLAALEQVGGLLTASQAHKLANLSSSVEEDGYGYVATDDAKTMREKAAVRKYMDAAATKSGKAASISGSVRGDIVSGGRDVDENGRVLRYDDNHTANSYIKGRMSATDLAGMDADELRFLREYADEDAMKVLQSKRDTVMASDRLRETVKEKLQGELDLIPPTNQAQRGAATGNSDSDSEQMVRLHGGTFDQSNSGLYIPRDRR